MNESAKIECFHKCGCEFFTILSNVALKSTINNDCLNYFMKFMIGVIFVLIYYNYKVKKKDLKEIKDCPYYLMKESS